MELSTTTSKMSFHNTIKVSSANVQGIRDMNKRIDVITYLLKDANIICLQDTHLTKLDTHCLRTNFPNCEIFIEGNRTNARGVLILLKKNFEYKIKYSMSDNTGNLLLLDLDLGEISLRLINIYAPNTDNPSFFKKVSNFVEESSETYSLLCGDLNLVLDPKLDSYNYVSINNPKAREVLLQNMDKYNLTDIFRQLHSKVKRYTWRRKNPIKQARLDYAIGTNSLMDIIQSCKILPGYRSDHSRLELDLLLNSFTKGKGIWRLNCSLLRDPEYLKCVKNCISEVRQQYAIPVYQFDNLDKIEDKDIQFTISDTMFLEMLLLNIRGNSIRFSSRAKRQQNDQEKELQEEIANLESREDEENFGLINTKKEKFQEIRDSKLQGFMIRSRVQDILLNEKPTKFFCNLEKAKYIDKTIKKVTLQNGKIINNQRDNLNQVKCFYAGLFSCKNIDEDNLNDFKNTLPNSKKLSPEESIGMSGPLTITELSNVLKSKKNNKTPGLDGFPAEFYKIFWKELQTFILRALNESYQKGILPPSFRQTVISCLPKGNKPRDDLKNWRPISLTSVLYNMVTSAIASRLKKVLPDLISNCQTGFIKGRFIGESTRLVYDIMNYTEKNPKKQGY